MEFFKEAIECLPDNWRSEDYSNQNYVLVDLKEDSEEYKEIRQYCDEHRIKNVTEIKRIQHPFAYLRFQLHRELHNLTMIEPNREIVPVEDTNLDAYIQYNCDDRRNIRRLGTSSSGKYVIKKYISIYSFATRDVNWYPEYLITTDPTSASSLSSAFSLLQL